MNWAIAACPATGQCPCGRGLPLMEQVTGRTADFLRAEAGYRVQGISIIENTLTKLSGIRQMQIVQEEPLRLQVHLVPGPGWGRRRGGRPRGDAAGHPRPGHGRGPVSCRADPPGEERQVPVHDLSVAG
jgi:hypothetical protein